MPEFNRTESFNLDKMFCCVLVEGKSPEGEQTFVYFGIHLHNLIKVLEAVKQTGSFNPKDYNAAVLAWARGGVPSESMREFMREKFSFHEDKVVLELVSAS